MNLKMIFPMKINFILRHFTSFLVQKKIPIQANNKRRVFFLDTPAYGNLGDQAIAFAMMKYVKEKLPEYEQIEITEDQLPHYFRWLKRNVTNSDIICLTGGGNMGVMYQRYEALRRLIISNFKNKRIIIFPQTIDYGNDLYSQYELKNAIKIYGKAKKLIICAREEKSYLFMKNHFINEVIFSPDIVLSLDYRNLCKEKKGVGICLRKDKESVLTDSQRDMIYNKIKEFHKIGSVSTTIDIPAYSINQNNRQFIIEEKLKEFSKYHTIITDRLHGMIFSYITNTNCVALPNVNDKVRMVSSYLKENGDITFFTGVSDFYIDEKKVVNNMRISFENLDKVFLGVK